MNANKQTYAQELINKQTETNEKQTSKILKNTIALTSWLPCCWSCGVVVYTLDQNTGDVGSNPTKSK